MSSRRPSTVRCSLSSISPHRVSTSWVVSAATTKVHSLDSSLSRRPLSHTAIAGLRPKRSCRPPTRWRFSLRDAHPGREMVTVMTPMFMEIVRWEKESDPVLRHQDEILIAPVDEARIALDAFHFEAVLFVEPAGREIVVEHHQLHAFQSATPGVVQGRVQ